MFFIAEQYTQLTNTAMSDIELTTIRGDLSDETLEQIMTDLNVSRCEKCNRVLAGDFAEHRVCEECLYQYCIHCIKMTLGGVSCICTDCADGAKAVLAKF
jgi:hypothetical protein